MGTSTYKDLFQLVQSQIDKAVAYRDSKTFRNQLDRGSVAPLTGNFISDIATASLVSSVQALLSEALPGVILSGLEVTANSPVSNHVLVSAGRGSKGGVIYYLEDGQVVPLPLNDTQTEVFYICLVKDRVSVEKQPSDNSLILAKVVVPEPGNTTKIFDRKEDRDDDTQPYIVGFKEFKLYEDKNGNLEDDSLEKFRNNIGPILSDNLIGNIRLSENLKITNTQGSVSLDSNSLKLFDSSDNLLAKFNQQGTFFYDDNNTEVARFTRDDARIGNILIEKNAIQSADFVSENKGFRIQDTGYAEFENVRVRGRISSSVFEYDKISAVGGKLLIGNASVIATDMTALDSATLTVDDSVFAVGEVLRIKEGSNEEYFLVTSIASAPTYTVTRDLAGSFSSNSNPQWAKGTAVVSMGNGQSGSLSGFISLDAVSQYSPFIDIASRNSTTYNDYTIKARLGNLAGISDACFGGSLSGYGLYSENVYLKGCLAASTILGSTLCSNTIYSTTINSSTFQTGTSGQRLVFDNTGITGYDSSCCQKLQIGTDGRLIVKDICLVDATNECIYSYISAGAWYHRDQMGNITPYVKKVCQGSGASGAIICFPFWASPPNIQVTAQSLMSYNCTYTTSSQQWCIYADAPTYYCLSGNNWGYCTTIHASLYKSSGTYDECVQNKSFVTSFYTNICVCSTVVKATFQLWKNSSDVSSCYCYGELAYVIHYRCCLSGCAWCTCNVCYCQAHATLGELQSSCTQCTTLNFNIPSGQSGGQFEIYLTETSVAWCNTLLPVSSLTACCRPFAGSTLTHCQCGLSTGSSTSSIAIDGTNPSNVQCNIFCICGFCSTKYCQTSLYTCHGACVYTNGQVFCGANGCYCTTSECNAWRNYISCVNISCVMPTGCNSCTYSYICLWALAGDNDFSSFATCTCVWHDGGYLLQCYYPSVSATSCQLESVYSTHDTSGSQVLLDPSGCLNYLAIGYS